MAMLLRSRKAQAKAILVSRVLGSCDNRLLRVFSARLDPPGDRCRLACSCNDLGTPRYLQLITRAARQRKERLRIANTTEGYDWRLSSGDYSRGRFPCQRMRSEISKQMAGTAHVCLSFEFVVAKTREMKFIVETHAIGETPVVTFCWYGNPESFFSLARGAGYQLKIPRAFRDHLQLQASRHRSPGGSKPRKTAQRRLSQLQGRR